MTLNKSNITKKELIEFGLHHFANESYVNQIIANDKFCSHGSWLSDCDELFDAYEEKYPNASKKDKVELKALLMDWLPLRIRYIANDIIDEIGYFSKLHRAAYFSPKHISKIKESKDNLPTSMTGVYWSSREDTYPLNTKNINDSDQEVLLTIPFETTAVDWFETFVSRIDYINGDQEQEYRLKDDARVTLLSIK